MRKTVVFASLFIYLCATTSVGELLKAPVLFSHFIEHKADNETITFYTFIYQHYQDDDGNDQDNDRDSQLPFKSLDSQSFGSSCALVFLTKIKFTPFSQSSFTVKANYKEPNIPSPYLTRIWQPPKNS